MEEVSDGPGCRSRDARIAELDAAVRALAAQVKDLTARLDGQSPPPRPAPDLPAAPDQKPSGRKPGGRPGHLPHLKTRLPPERVTRTIPLVPTACTHGQAALPQESGPDDPDPSWHQIVELPAVTVTVTEYQGHSRTCPCCGRLNQAPIPDDVRRPSVGPHRTAVLGYLTGAQGVSKRGVEEIAETIFGAPLALGTVSKSEQELSAAVAGAHTQAPNAVRDAAVKHVDETGWKENGRKRWLWVAATRLVAVFVIHPWRNVDALKSLLGGQLRGTLCRDRWVAYRRWPDPFARPWCWAHRKRNWEKMVERGGEALR